MVTLPKIVLPKVANILKSPGDGLAEIRSTLNQTATNVETRLPRMGGQSTGKGLPRLSRMVKSVEEKLPFKVPSMANLMVKKIEMPLTKTSSLSTQVKETPMPQVGAKVEAVPGEITTSVPTLGALSSALVQPVSMQGARGTLE
jgi:hypothetical protein